MAIIFKPILPKPVKDQAMRDVLASEVAKYTPFIKADFEKTTAGWKAEKPTFAVRFNRSTVAMSLSVTVGGNKLGQDKWTWLNYGTRPHRITPHGNYRLRFPGGRYQAGSRPGRLNTYPASPAGGPMVYAKAVMHPGFPARDWLGLIRQTHERTFTAWMTSAMSWAARASGHKI